MFGIHRDILLKISNTLLFLSLGILVWAAGSANSRLMLIGALIASIAGIPRIFFSRNADTSKDTYWLKRDDYERPPRNMSGRFYLILLILYLSFSAISVVLLKPPTYHLLFRIILLDFWAFVICGNIGFWIGAPTAGYPTRSKRSDSLPQRTMENNTNLTAISDWISKIIGGLILVNLFNLRSVAKSLTNFMDLFLKDPKWSGTTPAAVLTCLIFILFGLLFGYTYGKLFWRGAIEPTNNDSAEHV